jgi:O-6-methylguanine DNA methyltransferase
MEQLSFSSPLGWITLTENEGAISQLEFKKSSHLKTKNSTLNLAKKELEEYFKGKRKKFDVPLSPQGTPFQQKVWKNLQKIGWGDVSHYEHLAKLSSSPKGQRAIGNAVGKNPLAIIIPCHRILRKNGALGGFSGGISKKVWLLKHEGSLHI